ncbi:MAG: hypothetical protein KKH98_14460 [Spirochaetes bacterium]|nr:hypothetical protein [Spirochaetota bacterium]
MIKKILSVILLIILPAASLVSDNRNIRFSIENKIFDFMKLKFNIENNDILIHQIDLSDMPEYDLYEIRIMDKENISPRKDLTIQIRISDFFNKSESRIITVRINLIHYKKIPDKSVKLKIGQSIKIVYNSNHIRFFDRGTVKKKLNSEDIIIQNSFDQLLKCRIISDQLAEVVK